MNEEPHYNLLKNIRESLDVLYLGGMKKIVIKDKDVILEYQGLSIWITESCMRFQLHLQGTTADLNTEEMTSLTYLMKIRSYSDFLPAVQNWIDKKYNLNKKQDYTDKLRLIQNEVSYLYDKIEDIIKKEVKESL